MNKFILALLCFALATPKTLAAPITVGAQMIPKVASPAQLPSGAAIGDSYISRSDASLYIWTGAIWQGTVGGGAATWGGIAGTLSNQLDLQAALDLKLDIADFNTSFDTAFAAKDTDDLSEGAINLYFTDLRAQAAVISQVITNGVLDKSPSEDAVFDALALKYDAADFDGDFDTRFATKDTDDLSEGAINLYFTDLRAQAAVISQVITNGVLDQSPSEDAVFDALALKYDSADFAADWAAAFAAEDTDGLSEGAVNLYFTEARVRSTDLLGFVSGAGVITAADTVLSAIEKLDGNVNALVTGVSSVFGRVGAVVSANGDYTASQVTNVAAGNIAAVTVQAAIDELDTEKEALANKNQNNGYAGLDAGGKILSSQLPNTVMEFHGQWNANTNTPALADGVGNAGDVYRANVAGTTDFGSGGIAFQVGDWAVYNGTIWEFAANSNLVMSVNGQQGVVVLDAGDIGNTPAGDIAATDVQAAINELDAEKEPLLVNSAGLAAALSDETGTGFSVFSASPALTGNPTAPTQAALDNSTKISTTAYVDAAVAASAGSPTFTGDTTFGGHIINNQAAATATVNANAGTGATCTLTGGKDMAGTVNIVSGSAAWAGGEQCKINFNTAYASAPKCVITPVNSASAAAFLYIYVTKTVNDMSINFTNPDNESVSYSFDYHCFETL